MISVFLSSLIIGYSIYNLIDIKRFLRESEGERFGCSEALMLVFIYLWLIVNIFLLSGPIVLVIFVFIVSTCTKNKVTYTRLFFILLILVSFIIALNDIYFNFSIWHYLFGLL